MVTAGAVGVGLVFAAFFTELEPLANHTFLWAHLLQNVVLFNGTPSDCCILGYHSAFANPAFGAAGAASYATALLTRITRLCFFANSFR